MNELIKKMEKVVGNKEKVKYIEKQKGDVQDTLADVSEAEAKLNWNPRVNINKGLKRFLEWFISISDKME